MPARKQRDILIIGQGLAGSALALALREQGASVLVVDDCFANAASRVAVGLITTLAGKGMNPAWRQQTYLPEALVYYRNLEQQSGKKLLHMMPIVRPFDSPKQQQKFEKKKQHLSPWLRDDTEMPDYVKGDDGYFTMAQSGRLHTERYLEVVADLLGGDLVTDHFDENAVEFTGTGLNWNGFEFKKIIYCNGYEGLKSRFWDFLPHRSAKGEMLVGSFEGVSEDLIISRNGWIVPIGSGEWKVGATYRWDQLDTDSTEEGICEVREKVNALVSKEFTLHTTAVGIRPIINNSQPVIGLHHEVEQVGIFNGLGSRGVMTARSVAVHFAHYLLGKVELDEELNYRRLLK